MTMPLAPSYDYCAALRHHERVIVIVLTELATGKTKKFECAGKSKLKQLENLAQYMESLTDDLCSQWFPEDITPEERKRRQKEAKARAKEEKAAARVAGSVIMPPSA